jgi:hypothetical protein
MRTGFLESPDQVTILSQGPSGHDGADLSEANGRVTLKVEPPTVRTYLWRRRIPRPGMSVTLLVSASGNTETFALRGSDSPVYAHGDT